jgi:MHS family proline/betaine transporter-like MFS transporter
MQRRYQVSLFMGNILDHFDKSLYGLLVPFLAPLFFPESSLLAACSALFFPIGFLARPLGAIVLGRIGDRISQEKALWLSLQGVCISTAFIGFLPTSSEIGPIAYILLMLLRALLSFFSAGEAIGCFLMMIKDPNVKKKSLWTSIFEMSGIIGTFFAIFFVAIMTHFELVELLWRGLFFLSGLFCLGNLFLRKKSVLIGCQLREKSPNLFQVLWQKKKTILYLSLLGGFSYVNYEVVMSLMNIYYSLKGVHSYESMLWMSALLILIDMLLLPLFGLIGEKIGKHPLMMGSLICYIAFAPLWSYYLQAPTTSQILLIRTALVTLGVAFCASIKLQFLEMTKGESSYLTLSLSKAIAAQCLGYPTLFASLKLLGVKNLPSLFLIYPTILAFCSLVILFNEEKKKSAVKIVT